MLSFIAPSDSPCGFQRCRTILGVALLFVLSLLAGEARAQTAPDLIALRPSASAIMLIQGQSFTLFVSVENEGDRTSEITDIVFYRSLDMTITTSDIYIGQGIVSSLAPMESSSESINVVASSDEGTYYYGACVVPVSGESDTDDNCSPAIEVSVSGSDQIITETSVSDSTPGPGEFLLFATVRNQGVSALPSPTTLRYYQSSNATITTSDTEVGQQTINSLDSLENISLSISLETPPFGLFYYGVCVDSVDEETDTSNNCSQGIQVIRDNHGNTRSEATFIPLGSSVEGQFQVGSDIDYFRVQATIPGFLIFFSTKNNGRNDPEATLENSLGSELIYDDDGGIGRGNFRIEYPITTPSIYYLRVNAHSFQPDPGIYTLHTDFVTDPGVLAAEPDLVVDSPSASETLLMPDQTFTLSATVRNNGGGVTAATTLRYYLSTDSTITTGDTEVGTADSVSGLDGGRVSFQATSLIAPSSLGTYYYGACAAPVSGETDTTNNCSQAVEVTVTDAPDLVVDPPLVSSASVIQGQPFTLSATVRNRGAGPSTTTTLRYYRSTDATITTSDTEETGAADTVSVIAVGGTDSHSAMLTVPSTAGTYYYGACVESVSGESDTGNNCSQAVEVRVTGRPDLIVELPSVSDSSVEVSETFSLFATVRNQGGGASPRTDLRFYLSSDAIITTSDTLVATSTVSGLNPSATSPESVLAIAPSTPGTYYYGACVEPVSAEPVTNNNCSDAVRVEVGNFDLIVESSVDDNAPLHGSSFTLSATVRNQGMGPAGAGTVLRYYRSTDETVTASDTEVGMATVSALAGLGTSSHSTVLTVSSTPGDVYYYGACVESVSGELDTDNNCSGVRVAADDYVDARSDTGITDITLGDSYDGRIDLSGDVDYFRFQVSVSGMVTISAVITNLQTDDNIGIMDGKVENSAGSELTDVRLERESLELLVTPGVYYLNLDAAGASDIGSYTLNTDFSSSGSDLAVDPVQTSNRILTAGESFTLSATVLNQGIAESAATTLRYYRSTDMTITTSDTEETSPADTVGMIASGANSVFSASLTAPSTPGTYYYGACVESVPGESVTNNNCSEAVGVVVVNEFLIINPENLTVTEGGEETYTLRLARQPPSHANIVINKIRGGSDDINIVMPTSLEFPVSNWSGTRTVVVTADEDDDIINDMATLNHRLSGLGSLIEKNVAVTVADNDMASVAVAGDLRVNENAGVVEITVTVDKAAPGGFTVRASTRAGTAVAGDYTDSSETLRFNGDEGETKVFIVPVIDDSITEPTETFDVRLDNLQGTTLPVVITDDTATVTIVDNEVPMLSIADLAVSEDDGTAIVSVVLNDLMPGPFTVDVSAISTTGDTATAGGDYTAVVSRALTFNGTRSEIQTFAVSVIDDSDVEPRESFTVSMSNVSEAAVNISDTATVTIDDNDTPLLAFERLIASEGDDPAVIVVRLHNEVVGGVRVNVGSGNDDPTSASSAVEGIDFISAGITTLTFGGTAGETKEFQVQMIDDDIRETKETFRIFISRLEWANRQVLSGSILRATVDITDNDGITLTMDDVVVSEDDGAATITVTLREEVVGGGFNALVSTDDRSAMAGEDYESVSLLVLPFNGRAGETRVFTIPLTDDNIPEPRETFTLTVQSLRLPAFDTGDTATVTIDDNDRAVTASPSVLTVQEGFSDTYTVELSALPSGDVTVSAMSPDSGAVALSASDCSAVSATLDLIFTTANPDAQAVRVCAVQDGDTDGENVTITHGVRGGGYDMATVNEVDVTVFDDDTDITVEFVESSYTVTEGGAVDVIVTLSEAPGPGRTLFAFLRLQSRTADDDDYSGINICCAVDVTFRGTETAKTFAVMALPDNRNEGDETINLELISPSSGVTLGGKTATTITIKNLTPVTVEFAEPSYMVAEGGTANVEVRLSETPGREVIIPIRDDPGGRIATVASNADYNLPASSVTFVADASGDTLTQTFEVMAEHDSVNDDGEFVLLSFGDLTGSPGVTASATMATTTVEIEDDDDPVVTVGFLDSDYSVTEGDTAQVLVSLSETPEREIIVAVERGGGTADISDYGNLPATLTFASTSSGADLIKTVSVSTGLNTVNDGDRTVNLRFASPLPSGVMVTTVSGEHGTSTVTIVDDDDPEITVSFVSPAYSVDEGATIDVTVTLSADPERTVEMPIVLSGSATGADYTLSLDGSPLAGIVTFNAGDTAKVIRVDAIDDPADDDAETVVMTLGALLPTGVTASVPMQTTVTIVDNDDPDVTVSFVSPAYSVNEGATIDVTVTLSADPERTVEMPIVLSGSATGADYTLSVDGSPLAGIVTFNAGDTAKVIRVDAIDDSADDDAETVVMTLGAILPTGVTASVPMQTTVTIVDNDDPDVTVSFVSPAYSVNEGGSVDVALTLSATPEREITIPFTVSGSALRDTDYTLSSNDITFAASASGASLTQIVTVPTIQDTVVEPDETVVLGFGDLSGIPGVTAVVALETVVTIVDNDSAILTIGDAEVTEDEGMAEVAVTVDNAVSGGFTVNAYAITEAGDSATANVDYMAVTQTLTFTGTAGERRIFSVPVTDDGITEGPETFTVGFSSIASGAITATGTGTVTILDDDHPDVTVRFASGSAVRMVNEGDATNMEVELSAMPGREITIPLTVSGSALRDTDYTLSSSAIIFAADASGSALIQTVTVTTTEDTVVEPDETVVLGLGDLSGIPDVTAVGALETVVTIVDNDNAVLTIGDAEVTEGEGMVEITVTVDNAVSGGFMVSTYTIDDSATANVDYMEVTQTLIFTGTAGERRIFSVPVTDDGITEGPETFTVGLSRIPSGAITTTATGTVTIHDPSGLTRKQRGTVHQKTVGALSRGMAETAVGLIGRRMGAQVARVTDVQITHDSVSLSDLQNGDWQRVVASKVYNTAEMLSDGKILLSTAQRQSRFVAPLSEEREITVWGAGGGQSFNADFDESSLRSDYDGDLFNALIGIDGVLFPGWRLGVALGYGKGDLDYNASGGRMEVSGKVEKTMASVYPYLSWNPYQSLNLWLVGGYGFGEYDISEVAAGGGTVSWNGVKAADWTAALGVEKSFSHSEDWDFALRLKGLWSRVELDEATTGVDVLPRLTSENWRLRFESEAGLVVRINNRDSFRPYGLVSVRWDGGDVVGKDSVFMDAGGGVRMEMAFGLMFDISVSTQVFDGDTEEKSATAVGGVSFDIGGDGKGFTASLERTVGSGLESSWRDYDFNDTSVRKLSGGKTEAEVGYGWEALNAYARSEFEEEGRSHILGFDFKFKSLNLNLETAYADNTGETKALIKTQMKF